MNRSNAALIAVALTFAAWTPLQSPAGELKLKIANPEPEIDASFGTAFTAVGSSGNILVSAPAGTVEGGSTGAVYLMDGRNGDLLQTYRSPSANGWSFGRAVATLSENDVLIGGLDFDGLDASGTIGRVYRVDATTGSLLKTFAPPNRREVTSFGDPIAAQGDKILVGATQSSIAGPGLSGAAYLLDAEPGKQLQRFLPPSSTFGGAFGGAIAFTGITSS